MNIIIKKYVPDFVFRKTTNITPEFLKSEGIKYLFVDIHNTIATHNDHEILEGMPQWLELMKKYGIKVIVTSNNFKWNVAPTSKKLGLRYIYFCCKPSPIGFFRAKRRLKANFKETAVVGDQIFTDVFGAHLLGMKALFVEEIRSEKSLSHQLKQSQTNKYLEVYKKLNREII